MQGTEHKGFSEDWISYACWLLGNNAYIAATTKPEMKKFGISWAMKLTGEAGFIVALLAG